MSCRSVVRTEDGFTLIEAMISLFLLAFIVAEMAAVSTYAQKATNFSRRLTEANMLAEGVLDKSGNTAYNSLIVRFSELESPPNPIVFDLVGKDGVVENYNETCTAGVPGLQDTTCTTTAGLYTITRTVTPLPVNPADPQPTFAASLLARVDVVVNWAGPGPVGEAQQIAMSTVRSKY